MPHSYPDGGQPPQGFTTPDIQIAEIAPRLGSIDTYRRTGRIAYLDDFSLNTWVQATASGSQTDLVSTPVLRGVSSLRLTPASSAGFFDSIYKRFPTFETTKIGLEISNAGPIAPASGMRFDMTLNRNIGGQQWYGSIRNSYTAQQIQYSSDNLTWTPVFNYSLSDFAIQWSNIKIVFDFTVNPPQITRMYYNDQKVILSVNMQITTTVLGESTSVELRATDGSGAQKPVYVQDFILTLDEA